MRRDALKRMQDMQRRAEGAGFSPPPPPAPPPRRSTQGSDLRGLLGSILKPSGREQEGALLHIAGIPIDEEKAMIAMLIFILYKQGADVKLLLALGYLLL